MRAALLLLVVWCVSSANPIFYSSCSESSTRVCSYGTNVTDRLLSLKKGGSDILSTNNYDSTFFLCDEYNYDCGYAELISHFITVANGVQLNLTLSELSSNIIPGSTTLINKIKPYLSGAATNYQCVGSAFPLTLTAAESTTVLTGYLNRLASNLTTYYNANKASYATAWADLNINIKTAVIEMGKYWMNTDYYGGTFWSNFQYNSWAAMSTELKTNYVNNNCLECLRSAYLIDSVTIRCNKYQSVNFLVDQSGSIGASNFQYALKFVETYVGQTFDDLSIMSVHFYSTNYQTYIGYGNNRANMISMIQNKPYSGGGTYTGRAINASVATIASGNYPNGVPKLLVILTDGGSVDNVYYASEYARSQGITLFCVGIGSGINVAQLKQIAGTDSNILYITAYNTLEKLAYLIENYFCKQIRDVNLYDSIIGNVVRVPTSPNYYRVQRSSDTSIYYQLRLTYANDPATTGEEVRESHFDPFPDAFSEYAQTENYRTSILVREYYISPQSPEVIPQKKLITLTQTPTHAYVSVAGTAMNFNITLLPCNTSNCTVEREQAAIENAAIMGIDTNSSSNGSSGSTTGGSLYGGSSGGGPNVSVFVGIGTGLAIMGLCTAGIIGAAKKSREAPE
jgi:hypothetical protein